MGPGPVHVDAVKFYVWRRRLFILKRLTCATAARRDSTRPRFERVAYDSSFEGVFQDLLLLLPVVELAARVKATLR